MLIFTTISDVNYLDRGIALYESMNVFLDEYRLYYLCMDEPTFNKWEEINDERVVPILMETEFQNNPDFAILKVNNISVPVGLPDDYYRDNNLFPGYSDFHFALGSFFTHYIMTKENPKAILYVDSDILFYHSPQLIFDAMKDKSIGIIRHRHNEVGCVAGGYNVGIVYFRNNEIGCKCLEWWRNVVMNKDNPWFKTHGGCGDQKYLELFRKLFGDVKILDDNIGHGAPWNFHLYGYFPDKTIIEWNGGLQPLVFIHFSHFNYTATHYRVARRNEWSLYEPAKRYYDEYYTILRNIKMRYNLCI